MQSITRISRKTVMLLAALGWTAGCHEYVNPWRDDTVSASQIRTSSVTAATAQQHESAARQRSFSPSPSSAQDGSTRHFPLWFEDPFEDRGSDDDQYAWTAEDYIGMPYGLARFILNGLCVPISAVVHPPVPLMVSDGITSRQALGYDHDADWRPDGVSPVPPDVLELGATSGPADDPAGAENEKT